MNIRVEGETIHVTELRELGAAHAKHLRDQCSLALGECQKFIEIDLSQIIYLDSMGLGALLFLHNSVSRRDGCLRLLNPTQPALQLLELTRLHKLVEIITQNDWNADHHQEEN